MLKVANSVINASRITGVLPVVNGGTGVTTSTGTGNTVLSAAPTLSGNVTLSTGNLIVASGQGIDFSATSSGSGTMTSELLADYEEGTWTPSQGGGLTVIGAFSSSGYYTLIGRTVYFVGKIAGATSVAVAAGGLFVGNLPYSTGGYPTTGTITNADASAASHYQLSGTNIYSVSAILATSAMYFSGSITVGV